MNKKSSNYAIVFDMDGVIFNSEQLSLECWKQVAIKHNICDIEPAVYSCLGNIYEKAKEKMKQIYGASFDYDGYKKEKTALYKQMYQDKKLHLKPGVWELLSFLKNRHVPIGLATSTVSGVVKTELNDYGLIEYFDTLVCGDMIMHGKPDPEVYLKACDNLGYNPNDCYAIEDSYNGILAANRAGMKVIMVPDLLGADILDESTPAIVKSSLIEVCKYLKKKNTLERGGETDE